MMFECLRGTVCRFAVIGVYALGLNAPLLAADATDGAGSGEFLGLVEPTIAIEPASFSFELGEDEQDTRPMSISNIGTGTLSWTIDFDQPLAGLATHDPVLDEELVLGDFSVDSPANAGVPVVVTVPGGLASSSRVVGLAFEGTVSGISDHPSWASDLCMQVEAPDGTFYTLGGSSESIENCALNAWDFQGGGSSNSGTYVSVHDDLWAFPPGISDTGDWIFTFINGWDSLEAATMDWTDVVVTLLKAAPPEPCDFFNEVDWLSVDPASGSIEEVGTDLVTITADSSGLASGLYEASLCVSSNDAISPLLSVPVSLQVEGPVEDEVFQDRFED